jgi:hypothetical protein
MAEAWETIIHVSWMQGLLLEDMLDGWRCSYPHKELVDFTEISASKYTRKFFTGYLHYLLSICVESHSCFKKFSMIPIVNYKNLLVNTFLTAQTFSVG